MPEDNGYLLNAAFTIRCLKLYFQRASEKEGVFVQRDLRFFRLKKDKPDCGTGKNKEQDENYEDVASQPFFGCGTGGGT